MSAPADPAGGQERPLVWPEGVEPDRKPEWRDNRSKSWWYGKRPGWTR